MPVRSSLKDDLVLPVANKGEIPYRQPSEFWRKKMIDVPEDVKANGVEETDNVDETKPVWQDFGPPPTDRFRYVNPISFRHRLIPGYGWVLD